MAVYTFNKNNFAEEVLNSDKPVLVDFWASWCGPCRMFAPIIDAVAEEYPDEVKVGKINVDEESELAQQYRVASIPTLIMFQNGEAVKRSVGVIAKDDVVALFR
ncbi:MAG: thioredoxin [Clostridia bacterium]